jgi:uncharacterized protein (TIGR02453 family)
MTDTTFSHFPNETIEFYRQLEHNNNREWFEAHKQDYLDYVQKPSLVFITAMGERLKEISSNIVYDTRTNGAGSLMRIYRDIRFSPDKTPYKTNLGIVFWEGEGKKSENPGFYFHVAPYGIGFFSGMYGFNKQMLNAYRAAVIDETRGIELVEVINNIQSSGYETGGEHYKRVPRNFDPDHRRADLLKYNTLYASITDLNPELMTQPEFMDVAFGHWKNMAPLHRWLVKVASNL